MGEQHLDLLPAMSQTLIGRRVCQASGKARKRRLNNTDALGCEADTAELGNMDERAQLSQFHHLLQSQLVLNRRINVVTIYVRRNA